MSGTTSGAAGPFPPDTGITGAGTREAQVTRLYDTLFDRAPDSAGLAFWTAALNRGVALDTVADLLVRSQEFQSRGALGNADFVGLMYQNGLERAADAPGLNFWTGGLQQNTVDRGGVALAISETTEGVASSLARGTGTGTGAEGAGAGAGTGAGSGTDGAGADSGADATGTQIADGTTGTGAGTGTTGTQVADGSTSTDGVDSDGSGIGTETADGPTGTGSGTTSTGAQTADGPTGTAGAGSGTTGTGTGTQAASAGDAGTGTGLGDDASFSFVQIRTPDGELLTVRVVGEDLPVGSEVVDSAAVDGTPDAVVFPEGAQEAASLSSQVWFMG